MIKKILLLAILQLSISSFGYSQETPLFNTYVFDPYIYNPAYITTSGFSEVNVYHRRQWVAIDNAPVITSVNAQIHLKPRISLGANIINNESVLLNSTSAAFTFGYKVPLGVNNHFLGFGLSAGVFYNQFDLDEIAGLNDPALFNVEANNIDLTGQFGISYTIENFTIGFSLPQLFESNAFQSSELKKVGFGKLNNQIISTSYSTELTPIINAELFGNYRLSEDKLNFFEIGALASYNDLIKVGGFYRQNSGPGFILQVTANEKFLISYGHEFAANQDLSFGGSTHEFQLKIRLGKKAKQLVTKDHTPDEALPLPIVAQKEEPIVEEPETIVEEETTPATELQAAPEIKTEPEIEDKPVPEIIPEEETTPEVIIEEPIVEDIPEKTLAEEILPDKESSTQEIEDDAIHMETGYYLVVGSFVSETNARNFFKEVRKDFPSSEFGYNPSTHYYFIYIYKVSKEEINTSNIQKVRSETPFKDAWLMKLN
jgi:type IX secretion system PorP/SprF family membrane protein